ncbi:MULTISPECIES: hypothetical protein [Citrobacter freundii complex]|uniref:hypothetical protein n=1 Tax=Citrobacter freundii complex TaxID=1344959 RepID=UPI00200CB559|nr:MULTISPECIES: hypothetical protein [Citrobacter freundii complex]UQI36157.1 hypothetical protein M3L74_24025 [Citrobacter freundii]HCB1822431.1 hypothetical protein [Citrobacter amalonaticus]HCB1900715.1 hypothetical protein [Citrobacter amalonaticus]
MKRITIITLALLTSTTLHAGALAEMSAALAEQQKLKIVEFYEELGIEHGRTKSEIAAAQGQIFELANHMASLLDKVALEKNKSCLLIANNWLKEQEVLMTKELKEGNHKLTKDNYEKLNAIGYDYIKYKCLAQSDFLNNSGKNKDE